MRRVAVALVHYPVLDAEGRHVTTAITNLDVHDLARSSRSYGVEAYFLVHPIVAQRQLVDRITDHWRNGSSGKRIPDRVEALSRVRTVPSLADALAALGDVRSEMWITAARTVGTSIGYAEARARANASDDPRPLLIVFGTGWGLAQEIVDGADAVLAPIRAAADTGYNHLSVRAACAITLDRLFGEA